MMPPFMQIKKDKVQHNHIIHAKNFNSAECACGKIIINKRRWEKLSMHDFGYRLRTIREARGLSQKDIALKIDPLTNEAQEKGFVPETSVYVIYGICKKMTVVQINGMLFDYGFETLN